MPSPSSYIEILLQPGDHYFSTDPQTRIRTLLGSCVSVTLWHPKHKVGGMSHFLLPSRADNQNKNQHKLDGRYADESMMLLLQELMKTRLPLQQFQAKIFGGASMFAGGKAKSCTIGSNNIQAAHRSLSNLGLHPQAEHVGGFGHRNVIFDLWNGDVWVKQVDLK